MAWKASGGGKKKKRGGKGKKIWRLTICCAARASDPQRRGLGGCSVTLVEKRTVLSSLSTTGYRSLAAMLLLSRYMERARALC